MGQYADFQKDLKYGARVWWYTGPHTTQRAQSGLVQECTLTHLRGPYAIQGIFLTSPTLSSLVGKHGLYFGARAPYIIPGLPSSLWKVSAKRARHPDVILAAGQPAVKIGAHKAAQARKAEVFPEARMWRDMYTVYIYI